MSFCCFSSSWKADLCELPVLFVSLSPWMLIASVVCLLLLSLELFCSARTEGNVSCITELALFWPSFARPNRSPTIGGMV